MKEETNPTWKEVHGGFARDMTMREHYAGLAMQACPLRGHVDAAEWCYARADAMLKAREKWT